MTINVHSIIGRVYTRYPESPQAEWARFEEVFRGINSRNLEQRRPWIEKFKRDYPKSKYTATVDAHIRILEKWAAADKARMNKSFAPAGALAAGAAVFAFFAPCPSEI